MTKKNSPTKGFIDIPTAALDPAPWNYKRDNPFLQRQLEANIKANGQVENVIVREIDGGRFEVVNGNHRLAAFKALAFETVHAFNLGPISLAAAKRVAVETNETRFEHDPLALAEIVNGLITDLGREDIAKTLPFDNEELDGIVELHNYEWEARVNDTEIDEKSRAFRITVKMPMKHRGAVRKLIVDALEGAGLAEECEVSA